MNENIGIAHVYFLFLHLELFIWFEEQLSNVSILHEFQLGWLIYSRVINSLSKNSIFLYYKQSTETDEQQKKLRAHLCVYGILTVADISDNI